MIPRSIANRTRGVIVTGALLVTCLAAATASAQEFTAGDLVLEQPWARATPVGASVGGGYLVVRNSGEVADRLLTGSVPFAERVEIHESSLVDGVMTMRPLPDGLEIPAGGQVALAPGSYHLMFVGLGKPLVAGTTVEGTLAFERAGTVDVEFAVAPIGAARPVASGHGPEVEHGADHDADHSGGRSNGH